MNDAENQAPLPDDSKPGEEEPNDEIRINCDKIATIELGIQSFKVKEVKNPGNSSSKNICFIRPALSKRKAVSIYNAIIDGFSNKNKGFNFHFIKKSNRNRALFHSFGDLQRAAHFAPNPLSSFKLIYVSFNPEDGTAKYLRTTCPESHLIILATKGYLEKNEQDCLHADLVITPTKNWPKGINGVFCDDLHNSAPIIYHWCSSWLYRNNPGFIQIHGDRASVEKLRELSHHFGGNDLILAGNRELRDIAARATSFDILRSMFADVDACLVRVSHYHKYGGILSDARLGISEKISYLAQRGVHIKLINNI